MLRCFKIGYWHSSSEWTDCGYYLAKDEDEAVKYCYSIADGIASTEVTEVKSITELFSEDVFKFLMDKYNEDKKQSNKITPTMAKKSGNKNKTK